MNALNGIKSIKTNQDIYKLGTTKDRYNIYLIYVKDPTFSNSIYFR